MLQDPFPPAFHLLKPSLKVYGGIHKLRSWWNTQIKELEDLALGFTRCLALNFLVCKIRDLDKDANKFGKLSSGHRTEKVSFHCNSKEGQFQRMLKLLHNCTHFTCQQGHAQNPPSEALTIHELRTYRCTNWI